jgi:signal transduction histidine kinase
VSVSDNGPGIADLEKSQSVERFYRGDASRGIPGVGLGLSLVQAVAKLHGSALALSDQKLATPIAPSKRTRQRRRAGRLCAVLSSAAHILSALICGLDPTSTSS